MSTGTTTCPGKTVLLSTAASIAASAVLVRVLNADRIADVLQDYLLASLSGIFKRFSSQITVVIYETMKKNNMTNRLFTAAEFHLSPKVRYSGRRLCASDQEDSNDVEVTMEQDEEIVDVFKDMRFTWRLIARQLPYLPVHFSNGYSYHLDTKPPQVTRAFELTFHKKYKTAALKSYLPHILQQYKSKTKKLKFFTNEDGIWTETEFSHPATFKILAMDDDVKKDLIDDLDRFLKRKAYYASIGKAWKRGYLLYGPPGTGKTTLIAAMANYLRYDVYQLMLSGVNNNSSLKQLIVGIPKRSVLVVEDIDCEMSMLNDRAKAAKLHQDDEDKVTLSGLLNCIDGLQTTSGDEMVTVFTTNHRDRIDPALLRPGRMDRHIHMSYCSPSGFRILASNYHHVNDHPLFGEIESRLRKVEITPAEVCEVLLSEDDADAAFQGLIKLLQWKRKESREAIIKEEEVADEKSWVKED